MTSDARRKMKGARKRNPQAVPEGFVPAIRTRRLSLKFANKGKLLHLDAVDAEVLRLKNAMAAYVHPLSFEIHLNASKFFSHYNKFQSPLLDAHAVQNIFQDVVKFSANRTEKQFESCRFRTFNNGDDKKGPFVNRDLGHALRFLTFFGTDKTFYENNKSKAFDVVRKFITKGNGIFERLAAVAERRRKSYLARDPIAFTTGTHRIFVRQGKKTDKKGKPTPKKNEIFKDDKNVRFKYWVRIVYGKGEGRLTLVLPLQYNEKFFNPERIDADAAFLVKKNPKGFFEILAVEKTFDRVFEEDFSEENTLGADVNTRDNNIAFPDDSFIVPNKVMKQLAKEVKRAERRADEARKQAKAIPLIKKAKGRKKAAEDLDKEQRKLRKMQGKTARRAKAAITLVTCSAVKTAKDKGYRHLVFENVDFIGGKLRSKNKETDLVNNKVVKLLNLASIKHIAKNKARKLDISTHFVHSEYTSQECAKCGLIDKANRKEGGPNFVCEKCGHQDNADANAAKNIAKRLTHDVRRETLLTRQADGTYAPKNLGHERAAKAIRDTAIPSVFIEHSSDDKPKESNSNGFERIS